MLDDNLKLKLISLIEKKVVSILISENLVNHTHGPLTFNNVVLSKKGATKTNSSIPNGLEIDKVILLSSLADIFPKTQLDSNRSLSIRWDRFLTKTSLKDLTLEEVLMAAQNHVERYGPKFCGKLLYFFYKEDDKIYTSRLENTILELRDAENNIKNVDATVTINSKNK